MMIPMMLILDLPPPLSFVVTVGPGSLSGIGSRPYGCEEIAYLKDEVETGRTVTGREDERVVKELHFTTVDGSVVSGITSGSPIECAIRSNPVSELQQAHVQCSSRMRQGR